jgi:hypothetical protein
VRLPAGLRALVAHAAAQYGSPGTWWTYRSIACVICEWEMRIMQFPIAISANVDIIDMRYAGWAYRPSEIDADVRR